MPSDPLLKKHEPRDLEAEAACIGSMLLDKDSVSSVLSLLKKTDFYSERNGLIFEVIKVLSSSQNGIVDVVLVSSELKNRKILEKCGGMDYLNSLMDIVPSVANVEYYAKIVRQKALLRNLISTSKHIMSKAFDETLDVRKIIDEAEKTIFDIAERETVGEFVEPSDILNNIFAKIQKATTSTDEYTGVPSGFTKLDDLTDGFHNAELIIIAARPSMGKTAFVLNIALNVALKQKMPVAFFSLEMPREQLMLRLISSYANLEGYILRKPRLLLNNQEKYEALAHAAEVLSETKIFINDSSQVEVMDIRSRLRQLVAKEKIQLVVIDYLQLMSHSSYKDNRQQQIAEISRSLKSLARELDIPIIALSQLNRKVDERGGKDRHPQLSDLRESGAIEQDADLVLFIHRDEYYKKEKTPDEKKGKADIIVGKNRNGPLGSVELGFEGKYTKFKNILDYQE